MIRRRVLAVFTLLTFTLVSSVIGASYIASIYYYSPYLGRPFLELFGYKLYSLFSLLEWQNLLPESVIREGLLITFGGSLLGLLLAMLISYEKVKKDIKGIFGNAGWASNKDIHGLGLLSGKGIFVGMLNDGRYLRNQGPHHVSVIAPTRSGKGAGIVIPTLCTHEGSAIVFDIKAENYQRTSATRSTFSDVYCFNPGSLDSACFNPLFSIRKGINEVKDAQNLANIIIEPDRPGHIDHWIRTGNSLLTALILHVLYAEPVEKRNLAGVAGILSQSELDVIENLMEIGSFNHIKDENGKPSHPHPAIRSAIRDLLNKSQDDRSSVISTVMGYLSIYRDPLLANCTKKSDFKIEDLMLSDKPKTLYIVVAPSDIDRVRPITRILLNLICRRLCEPTDIESLNKRHELLLVLDEFPSLGRMEFFESALAFIAGFGIRALLVSQSLNQLKLVYGERSSILDNTHVQVFYTPNTVETAEFISRTLGDMTVDYYTRGESGSKGSPFFSNKNQSNHISRRALMTPREIMEFSQDDAILFIGNSKPIRCKKSLYFKDRNFLRMTNIMKQPDKPIENELIQPWVDDELTNDLQPEKELIQGLEIILEEKRETEVIEDENLLNNIIQLEADDHEEIA